MAPNQPKPAAQPVPAAPIGPLRAGSTLRTPRAAAVEGIIFSVLLIAALVLLRISVPANPAVPGAWLTDSRHRAQVAIALNLVPFAGIAFLWFIGVLRDRIGDREDRFFATVFLGSGLLFVAMIFAAAAIAGGLIAEASSSRPGAGTGSGPADRHVRRPVQRVGQGGPHHPGRARAVGGGRAGVQLRYLAERTWATGQQQRRTAQTALPRPSMGDQPQT